MLKRLHRQAGDTLIEVLFAVTVFSLVAVSSLAIMNQGTLSSQRSLEMSLVTQQIDNQAQALRFMHEAYVTNYQFGYESTPNLTLTGATNQFYRIVQHVKAADADQASPFGSAATCPTPPAGSFVLNTRTGVAVLNMATFRPATTYAELTYNATAPTVLDYPSGIWIEGVRSPVVRAAGQTNPGYIDFHIRGCWQTQGSRQPLTLGTIVRLYEPRN